jgi:hypothetical protein
MFYTDGPTKPPMLPPAFWILFDVAPPKAFVKFGLVVYGMWWDTVSSSLSSEVFWSRVPSVWSGASMRGSRRMTSDCSTRVTLFLGAIIGVFCRARENAGCQCWD